MSLKTFVNKSVPTLYMTELSPPVRSVLMTAYIIGLPLYRKEVNLISGEQRTAAYLKAGFNVNLRTFEYDHRWLLDIVNTVNNSTNDLSDESTRNGTIIAR